MNKFLLFPMLFLLTLSERPVNGSASINHFDEIEMKSNLMEIKWSIDKKKSIAFQSIDRINLDASARDSILIKRAIKQLDLQPSKIHNDFIVSKVRPNNPKETIIVIPEIIEESEGDFKLNGYLLIVNSETGKIISQYYDRDAWQSDAIILSEIIIDTAPYYVSENNQAFGIRANYYTMSQPNPYSNTTISLFVKSKNRLERVLNNYDVIDYAAEWDTRCAGQSVGHEKTLVMTAHKTNHHFDVLVKDKITATESFEDENGDCNTTEELTVLKSMLKFNGEEYTENGVFQPLDVFLNDSGENETNIRQSPNGKIIQKINQADDYYTLTITEAKNGWFKLVKIIGVEGDNVGILEGAGWIHGSVIGVATRKNIKLLDAPGSDVVVGTIELETGVRIKDKYSDWMQIEYNGLTGWIESRWLCGNPVTTCP